MAGADADNAQFGAGVFGEGADVATCGRRKVVETAGLGGVAHPAGERGVDGFAAGPIGGVGGRVAQRFAVELVSGADFEGGHAVKSVEVGDGEVVDAIDHGGVVRGDGVEPTAAAGAAGGGAKFAAHGVEEVGDVLVFRGEGAFADAGRVGFHHADDAVHAVGRDARTGAGAAGGRVRAGDKRVGAVVEIEVGALRAFEKEVASALDGVVEFDDGVGDVRA